MQPRLGCRLSHGLAVGPWVGCLTSLSLDFLNCKMGWLHRGAYGIGRLLHCRSSAQYTVWLMMRAQNLIVILLTINIIPELI